MDGSTTISDPGSGQDSYDLPSRQAAPFRPLQDIDATLISLLELAAESICIMDDQSADPAVQQGIGKPVRLYVRRGDRQACRNSHAAEICRLPPGLGRALS